MVTAVVPFEIIAQGVAYVGGTRVTLDSVIETFVEGSTAEEIVQRYPTLDLGDVYAVIAYYLHNREEIESFLQTSRAKSDEVRAINERMFPPNAWRERLMARKRS